MFTFRPFRHLIFAARMLLPAQNHEATPEQVLANLRGLGTALAEVERAHAQVQDSGSYIAFAREAYALDDDIDIDEEPMVSVGKGGRWVSAWVWVSDGDVAEK